MTNHAEAEAMDKKFIESIEFVAGISLDPDNVAEVIAAIRADERAKVEREWKERVQKLHRRAQTAESYVGKLECFRDGLGKPASEQIRQLHKHSQGLWRVLESQSSKIAALRKACEGLISYRDRNSTNFQTEKMDDFLHEMRVALQPPARGEGELT